MFQNVKNTKYIHKVKKSALIDIIEKNIDGEYGDVIVRTGLEDRVVIDIFTPFQPVSRLARITFYDYDVKIESPFYRSEIPITIAFLDLMEKTFEGYKEDWLATHEAAHKRFRGGE